MSRNLLIILTIIVIILASVLVIFVARGYQLDIKTAKVTATGILVATSDPDGAEVIIDGKLTTATNNTINLPPGKYLVKIQKDGYSPWAKTVTIKPEEVVKTSAFLFPNLPELRPLTLTGAKNPVLSPDGTKIAYFVASASAEKNGLWILDMGRPTLPNGLFSATDLRQILQLAPGNPLSSGKILWSADSKQTLLYLGDHISSVSSPGAQLAYLLETDRLNDSPVPVTNQLSTILTQWQALENSRYQAETAKLNPKLLTSIATAGGKLIFSPDENRFLYEATAAGAIPPILATYLPGTNPTPQVRQIKPGNLYVYDIKEDRNYEIGHSSLAISDPQVTNLLMTNDQVTWFPSSRHLLEYSNKDISVMEYDGTNKAVVYAGPFKPDDIFPWPDWSKIVILTSLNDSSGVGENLYTINLR